MKDIDKNKPVQKDKETEFDRYTDPVTGQEFLKIYYGKPTSTLGEIPSSILTNIENWPQTLSDMSSTLNVFNKIIEFLQQHPDLNMTTDQNNAIRRVKTIAKKVKKNAEKSRKPHREIPVGIGSLKPHKPEWMQPMKEYKKILNSIIKEEIDLFIKEWADSIYSNGKEIAYYRDDDAYPFGVPEDFNRNDKYLIDKIRVGRYGTMHGTNLIYSDSNPENNPVPTGRLWTNRKIIAFWNYPKSKQELYEVIDVINKDFKNKSVHYKIDNSWSISILPEDLPAYSRDSVIIPISDYDFKAVKNPILYKQELEKRFNQHTESPLKKSTREIPTGWGSKKVHEPEWLSPMKESKERKVKRLLIKIIKEEIEKYLKENYI